MMIAGARHREPPGLPAGLAVVWIEAGKQDPGVLAPVCIRTEMALRATLP